MFDAAMKRFVILAVLALAVIGSAQVMKAAQPDGNRNMMQTNEVQTLQLLFSSSQGVIAAVSDGQRETALATLRSVENAMRRLRQLPGGPARNAAVADLSATVAELKSLLQGARLAEAESLLPVLEQQVRLVRQT